MAIQRKKRRVAPSANSSDSDDNLVQELPEENNQELEIIDVDFAVSFPENSDKDGIKNLLQQLFQKARVNTAELADILIEQTHITGVVKESDDSEDDVDSEMEDVIYAVFSIVNITERKEEECIKQIRSYVLDHCKEVVSQAQYEMFKNIFEDSSNHVGLIIHERFVNMPAKMSVPVYLSLGNDMKKAKEKNEPYDFAYYLLICKTGTFSPGGFVERSIYLNAEEEIIADEAEFTFEFNIQTENESGIIENWMDDGMEAIQKRKVLLLPACKWDTVCNKLTAEFGTEFNQMFIATAP